MIDAILRAKQDDLSSSVKQYTLAWQEFAMVIRL